MEPLCTSVMPSCRAAAHRVFPEAESSYYTWREYVFLTYLHVPGVKSPGGRTIAEH